MTAVKPMPTKAIGCVRVSSVGWATWFAAEAGSLTHRPAAFIPEPSKYARNHARSAQAWSRSLCCRCLRYLSTVTRVTRTFAPCVKRTR
jgi:hypothetical protein